MRKYVFLMALVYASAVSLASYAVSTTFTVGMFKYAVISEELKEVSVNSVVSTGSDTPKCHIPSHVEYDGQTWTVVELGEQSLKNLRNCKELFIPNTIRDIKRYAMEKANSGTLIFEENDTLVEPPTKLRIYWCQFGRYGDPMSVDYWPVVQFSKIYIGREFDLYWDNDNLFEVPDLSYSDSPFLLVNQRHVDELVVGANVKNFVHLMSYDGISHYNQIDKVFMFSKKPPEYPQFLFVQYEIDEELNREVGITVASKLYVPKGCKNVYKFADSLAGWRYFSSIQEFYAVDRRTLDLNNDGEANTGDVSALYTAILGESYNLTYDTNGDGALNVADVSALYYGLFNTLDCWWNVNEKD